MDNLTHSLTGLMLSRAGLNRFHPRATSLLVIASNIPDIDIVTAVWGPLAYLDHHRGITHSLLFSPVMALLSVAIVRLWSRFHLLSGFVLAWIGVLGHVAMDWTNTYGIRLFLPFSDAWPGGHITNIVDIWIWGVLFIAVLGPALSRLVSSEIGARPGSGRGLAVFALAFLLVYESARGLLHERAVATLNSHLYEGRPARRIAAFPHFADPFRWMGYVEGDGFIVLQSFHLLGNYDPLGGEKFYVPAAPAREAARRTDTFQRYLRFASYPRWEVTPLEKPEGGTRVEASDVRFGAPEAKRFIAYVTLDAANRPLDQGFRFSEER